MTALVASPDDIDPVMAEAVDWIVRLSSGEATDADLRALDQWRAARPEHDAAFRRLAGLRPVARAVKAQPKVTRRAMLSSGGAALAAIGAFGLVRPPLGLWPSLAELMADHRTGPGQRFAFAAAPGAQVEMNSRTSIALIDRDAGLRLIEGEAFIRLERSAPFAVEAGEAQFTATRANFNVATLAGGVRLACLSGAVDCHNRGGLTRIPANHEWRLASDGATALRPIDPAGAASWRDGVLMFEGAPLGEVIEQLNRYRSAPIMLTDSSQGTRAVSGIFYTENTDAAVTQLQQLLGLRVRALPGNVILMG